MSIDWLTVCAQIVNFLILVWLLKRFLYRPIVDVMARREQRLADRLGDAASREQTAIDEANRYRAEREALQQRRDEILARAREDAEAVSKQMLEAGRQDAAAARASWQRQAAHEKTEFLTNLRRESAGLIQVAVRKALADLAGAELEAAMTDRFVVRLQSLPDADRRALARSDGAATVTSAFELAPTLRARLTSAVHQALGRQAEIEYRVSPGLVCGIELTRGGRRLSWSVTEYLDRLAERVDATFLPVTAAEDVSDGPARDASGGGQGR